MAADVQQHQTVRAEGTKAELADYIHEAFNAIISCPQCLRVGSNGTFRKSNAGNINAKGQRYRRFVCKCGELLSSVANQSSVRKDCTKTLSTTNFIEHCRQFPSIGSEIIDTMQGEIQNRAKEGFQSIGFSASKKRLGMEINDSQPKPKRRNKDSLLPRLAETDEKTDKMALRSEHEEMRDLKTEIINSQLQLQQLLERLEIMETNKSNVKKCKPTSMATGKTVGYFCAET
ncbi:hypothetical protein DFP73DRAFT_593715 [Morchella snyderi]|nr:hypothetical protein DFP73DRAFT_593715 [Morchella snyderi]